MKLAFYIGILLSFMACPLMNDQEKTLLDYPVYTGKDLGLTKQDDNYSLKIWAPTASKLLLHFYDADIKGKKEETLALEKAKDGVWQINLPSSTKGRYFSVQAEIDGKLMEECTEPYAKVIGRNGLRQMVAAPSEVAVEHWEKDSYVPMASQTDAIIYELHIRDMTIADASVEHPGKYIGLAQSGTKNDGTTTGLEHIKEMGVTHVHLLPTFDHRSIDETKLDSPQYNWGYDPLNYNALEGSFSLNPADGLARIQEFKSMVKSFHDNGIGVILDVVYNHTGMTEDSYFEQLVPGYYYRQNENGGFSDASACGNETASEREMVRKFITESVAYWTKEYHIDGFRFDLMGIHDIETMNAVASAVRTINPNALLYGEGWTASESPLPKTQRALKTHAYRMDNIAVFSDDMRDALKGYVFDPTERGFISGLDTLAETIKFGVVASTEHKQIDYTDIIYSDTAYAASPQQTVTYVSCHDNHTLWDRLGISVPKADEALKKDMHKLALATVLTSQGVAFLHAGSEFCRTKNGEENSYNKPDAINKMDWRRKKEFADVVAYVQGLIRLRKEHPAFRMPTTKQIQENLSFLETQDPQVVAYKLNGKAMGDAWDTIIVALNGKDKPFDMPLPTGSWKKVADKEAVLSANFPAVSTNATIPATSIWIGFQ